MAFNSDSSNGNGEAREKTEASPIDKIIAESRETLEIEEEKSRAGRKPKYGSDEERREARRAQNRAYKAAKRTRTDEAPSSAPTVHSVQAMPPAEPKPAGLAFLLDPIAEMPVRAIRAEYALTVEELPGLNEEQKGMLVSQADLCIGTFFPDAVNNKWVGLAALLATASVLYGGVAMQAREIAAAKAAHAATSAPAAAASSPSHPFPTAVF